MKKLIGLSLITISSVMASDGEESRQTFSISPITAAEKKEKEDDLPMEAIEQMNDIDQLDKYNGKVVAYTVSKRWDLEYLFRLQNQWEGDFEFRLKNKNDLILPIGYGILSIEKSEVQVPGVVYSSVVIRPFQRVHFGSEGDRYVANRLIRNIGEFINCNIDENMSEGCKKHNKKIFERFNIKIRLANKQEKKELYAAMLNDRFQCYNVEKSKVSKCLTAKD